MLMLAVGVQDGVLWRDPLLPEETDSEQLWAGEWRVGGLERAANAQARFILSRVKKKDGMGSTTSPGRDRRQYILAAVLQHPLQGKAIYQHERMAGMAYRERMGFFVGATQVQGEGRVCSLRHTPLCFDGVWRHPYREHFATPPRPAF